MYEAYVKWTSPRREDVNDIEEVKKMILDNRRTTIREVVDDAVYRSVHAKQFLRMF